MDFVFFSIYVIAAAALFVWMLLHMRAMTKANAKVKLSISSESYARAHDESLLLLEVHRKFWRGGSILVMLLSFAMVAEALCRAYKLM